jgi:hypothetical protein
MKESFEKKFELVWKTYQRSRIRTLKRMNMAERNVLLKRLVENNSGVVKFCFKIGMLDDYDRL